MVDVERNRLPHLVGNPQRLECCLTRVLRDSPRNARGMEHIGIPENLVPVEHPRLQFEKRRIGTVVHHLRTAHTRRLLIIIGAHAVAAPKRIGHPYAVFQQFHTRGLPYLVFWQSRHILHVVAHHGQRHGDIGFASPVCPRKRLTLSQSHAVLLGESKQQFAECYNLLVHTLAAKVESFLRITKFFPTFSPQRFA